MNKIDEHDARFEAALSLHRIAASYRKLAEKAVTPQVWGARLRLATTLEREAIALDAASNPRR